MVRCWMDGSLSVAALMFPARLPTARAPAETADGTTQTNFVQERLSGICYISDF